MIIEPHIITDPDFDWDRLRVKKFCLKLVSNFNWNYCSQIYLQDFVNEGWTFEKFKKIAEYDGFWNDAMFRLEKLHKLSTFA